MLGVYQRFEGFVYLLLQDQSLPYRNMEAVRIVDIAYSLSILFSSTVQCI